MPDFYLVSTELREPYEPRACRIVKRLCSELRDDLVLVEIEPSLPSSVYDTGQDIRQLILASRHEGTSLFPVTSWPLSVYICQLKVKDNPNSAMLASKDLAILDWGEIHQNRAH